MCRSQLAKYLQKIHIGKYKENHDNTELDGE